MKEKYNLCWKPINTGDIDAFSDREWTCLASCFTAIPDITIKHCCSKQTKYESSLRPEIIVGMADLAQLGDALPREHLRYFARNTGEVSRAGSKTKSSIKHPMIVTAESSPKEAIGLKFEKQKIANVAASATFA